MSKREKSLDSTTVSVIKALEKLAKRDAAAFWNKRVVFDMALEEIDSLIDLEDIPPNMSYYYGHWSKITPHAAKKYRKYIIPSTCGVRLGTFKEYQKINGSVLFPIMRGLSDRAATRTTIIVSRGGQSMNFEVSTKLLTAGEKTE